MEIVESELSQTNRAADVAEKLRAHAKISGLATSHNIFTMMRDKLKDGPALTGYVCSRWYRPPEILSGSNYDLKAHDLQIEAKYYFKTKI